MAEATQPLRPKTLTPSLPSGVEEEEKDDEFYSSGQEEEDFEQEEEDEGRRSSSPGPPPMLKNSSSLSMVTNRSSTNEEDEISNTHVSPLPSAPPDDSNETRPSQFILEESRDSPFFPPSPDTSATTPITTTTTTTTSSPTSARSPSPRPIAPVASTSTQPAFSRAASWISINSINSHMSRNSVNSSQSTFTNKTQYSGNYGVSRGDTRPLALILQDHRDWVDVPSVVTSLTNQGPATVSPIPFNHQLHSDALSILYPVQHAFNTTNLEHLSYTEARRLTIEFASTAILLGSEETSLATSALRGLVPTKPINAIKVAALSDGICHAVGSLIASNASSISARDILQDHAALTSSTSTTSTSPALAPPSAREPTDAEVERAKALLTPPLDRKTELMEFHLGAALNDVITDLSAGYYEDGGGVFGRLHTFSTYATGTAVRNDLYRPINAYLASVSAVLGGLFLFNPHWNPEPLKKAIGDLGRTFRKQILLKAKLSKHQNWPASVSTSAALSVMTFESIFSVLENRYEKDGRPHIQAGHKQAMTDYRASLTLGAFGKSMKTADDWNETLGSVLLTALLGVSLPGVNIGVTVIAGYAISRACNKLKEIYHQDKAINITLIHVWGSRLSSLLVHEGATTSAHRTSAILLSQLGVKTGTPDGQDVQPCSWFNVADWTHVGVLINSLWNGILTGAAEKEDTSSAGAGCLLALVFVQTLLIAHGEAEPSQVDLRRTLSLAADLVADTAQVFVDRISAGEDPVQRENLTKSSSSRRHSLLNLQGHINSAYNAITNRPTSMLGRLRRSSSGSSITSRSSVKTTAESAAREIKEDLVSAARSLSDSKGTHHSELDLPWSMVFDSKVAASSPPLGRQELNLIRRNLLINSMDRCVGRPATDVHLAALRNKTTSLFNQVTSMNQGDPQSQGPADQPLFVCDKTLDLYLYAQPAFGRGDPHHNTISRDAFKSNPSTSLIVERDAFGLPFKKWLNDPTQSSPMLCMKSPNSFGASSFLWYLFKAVGSHVSVAVLYRLTLTGRDSYKCFHPQYFAESVIHGLVMWFNKHYPGLLMEDFVKRSIYEVRNCREVVFSLDNPKPGLESRDDIIPVLSKFIDGLPRVLPKNEKDSSPSIALIAVDDVDTRGSGGDSDLAVLATIQAMLDMALPLWLKVLVTAKDGFDPLTAVDGEAESASEQRPMGSNWTSKIDTVNLDIYSEANMNDVEHLAKMYLDLLGWTVPVQDLKTFHSNLFQAAGGLCLIVTHLFKRNDSLGELMMALANTADVQPMSRMHEYYWTELNKGFTAMRKTHDADQAQSAINSLLSVLECLVAAPGPVPLSLLADAVFPGWRAGADGQKELADLLPRLDAFVTKRQAPGKELELELVSVTLVDYLKARRQSRDGKGEEQFVKDSTGHHRMAKACVDFWTSHPVPRMMSGQAFHYILNHAALHGASCNSEAISSLVVEKIVLSLPFMCRVIEVLGLAHLVTDLSHIGSGHPKSPVHATALDVAYGLSLDAELTLAIATSYSLFQEAAQAPPDDLISTGVLHTPPPKPPLNTMEPGTALGMSLDSRPGSPLSSPFISPLGSPTSPAATSRRALVALSPTPSQSALSDQMSNTSTSVDTSSNDGMVHPWFSRGSESLRDPEMAETDFVLSSHIRRQLACRVAASAGASTVPFAPSSSLSSLSPNFNAEDLTANATALIQQLDAGLQLTPVHPMSFVHLRGPDGPIEGAVPNLSSFSRGSPQSGASFLAIVSGSHREQVALRTITTSGEFHEGTLSNRDFGSIRAVAVHGFSGTVFGVTDAGICFWDMSESLKSPQGAVPPRPFDKEWRPSRTSTKDNVLAAVCEFASPTPDDRASSPVYSSWRVTALFVADGSRAAVQVHFWRATESKVGDTQTLAPHPSDEGAGVTSLEPLEAWGVAVGLSNGTVSLWKMPEDGVAGKWTRVARLCPSASVLQGVKGHEARRIRAVASEVKIETTAKAYDLRLLVAGPGPDLFAWRVLKGYKDGDSVSVESLGCQHCHGDKWVTDLALLENSRFISVNNDATVTHWNWDNAFDKAFSNRCLHSAQPRLSCCGVSRVFAVSPLMTGLLETTGHVAVTPTPGCGGATCRCQCCASDRPKPLLEVPSTSKAATISFGEFTASVAVDTANEGSRRVFLGTSGGLVLEWNLPVSVPEDVDVVPLLAGGQPLAGGAVVRLVGMSPKRLGVVMERGDVVILDEVSGGKWAATRLPKSRISPGTIIVPMGGARQDLIVLTPKVGQPNVGEIEMWARSSLSRVRWARPQWTMVKRSTRSADVSARGARLIRRTRPKRLFLPLYEIDDSSVSRGAVLVSTSVKLGLSSSFELYPVGENDILLGSFPVPTHGAGHSESVLRFVGYSDGDEWTLLNWKSQEEELVEPLEDVEGNRVPYSHELFTLVGEYDCFAVMDNCGGVVTSRGNELTAWSMESGRISAHYRLDEPVKALLKVGPQTLAVSQASQFMLFKWTKAPCARCLSP